MANTEIPPKGSDIAALTHAEWAKEKVGASRAGLVEGSNKVYTEGEWAKIRADKVAARKAVPA